MMSYSHVTFTTVIILLCMSLQNTVKCKTDELKFWKRNPKYWKTTTQSMTVQTTQRVTFMGYEKNAVDGRRRPLPQPKSITLNNSFSNVSTGTTGNNTNGVNLVPVFRNDRRGDNFQTEPLIHKSSERERNNLIMAFKTGDEGFGVEYTTQIDNSILNQHMKGQSRIKKSRHTKMRHRNQNIEAGVEIKNKHGNFKDKVDHLRNKVDSILNAYPEIINDVDKLENTKKYVAFGNSKSGYDSRVTRNDQEQRSHSIQGRDIEKSPNRTDPGTVAKDNDRIQSLISKKNIDDEEEEEGEVTEKKEDRKIGRAGANSDHRFKISGRTHSKGRSGHKKKIKTRGHWVKNLSTKKNRDYHSNAGFTKRKKKKLRERSHERITKQETKTTNKFAHATKPKNPGPISLDMSSFFSPYSIARQLHCLKKQNGTMATASIEQEVIGHTAEYNDIVLWKIKEHSDYYKESKFRASDNHKYEDEVEEKKIIFIVHALNTMGWEFLPCLSKVREFKKLLTYYLENLDTFDIFLIPMANPDGIKKINNEWNLKIGSFKWNKNASPQDNCPGVTLDRNFDVAWNVSLKNVTSCSPLYPGPEPFSERETKAIKDVFHLYGNKIVGYFHVHGGTYNTKSFKGDAVLYPKGYTEVQTDDDRYIDLRGAIDEALRNASFKIATVTVDTLHNWYGLVGGTSVDYASTIYGIPYSLELVMQVYKDDKTFTSQRSMDDIALTEVWQVVLDVIFDHIYRTEIKPSELNFKK